VDQTAHDIKTLQERERVNVHYMNQNAGHILDLLRRVEALEKGKTPNDVRELLAALEHEQWSHWTRYMLDSLAAQLGANGLPLEAFEALPSVERWRRQIRTPYADLSEQEKESDREWADKGLAIIEGV